MGAAPPDRIAWLSDLVRLEITLWNRVDARLRAEHDLPLAFFWPLSILKGSRGECLRVGEIADAAGITVGGASKIIDRIEHRGLLRREPDPDDRRASRVVLTAAGQSMLAAASETYQTEIAAVLDAALNAEQQDDMHDLMRRLLQTLDTGEID